MGAKSQLLAEWQKLMSSQEKKVIQDSWDNDGDGYSHLIEYQVGPGGQFHSGIEGDEPDGYDQDNPLCKEIVEQAAFDRWVDFKASFDSVAQDDGPAGELLIYRCIQVDDPDEFIFHVAHGEPVDEYKGIGIFWSWDEKQAQCHWGKGGRSVTVHACVPYSSIEAYDTLILNLSPSLGEDEAEIRLKEGSQVLILGVEYENEYYSPLDEDLPPVPMSAILAFEERPMPVAPEPDGSFDRENQVVEIGMPEMNNIPLKEALMVRPYYLDKEEKFMPCEVQYPAMHRLLKAERYKPEAPPVQKDVQEPVQKKEPEPPPALREVDDVE